MEELLLQPGLTKTESGLIVPQSAKEPEPEKEVIPETEILKHLFESTITFFRLVNKTMVALNYSRQKRRQVWDSLVKHSTIEDTDIIKALLNELEPILKEAKAETEKHQASQQSTQQQEEVK